MTSPTPPPSPTTPTRERKHPWRCETCEHQEVYDEENGVVIAWRCKKFNYSLGRGDCDDDEVLFIDLHGCASHSSAPLPAQSEDAPENLIWMTPEEEEKRIATAAKAEVLDELAAFIDNDDNAFATGTHGKAVTIHNLVDWMVSKGWEP